MIRKYDIVIVGAGPAGISAAIEASRSDSRVALIERYGVVGGNLTVGHVGPIMGGVCKGTIADEINDLICPAKNNFPDVETAKIKLTLLLDEAGVDVYLQTVVVDSITENGYIKQIETLGKEGRLSFAADVFIDATGDGDLSAIAGCQWLQGREMDQLVQPVSLMFTITGVDPEQSLTCCHEEHYTTLSDGREYLEVCRNACKTGELPKNVNIVRLYNASVPEERMVNATQENYIDPLKSKDLFKAEVELRKQIYQIVEFLKNNIEGFENITVKSSSSTLGVRESRRIIGDYIMTAADLINGRKFKDAVVHNAHFSIDIHNPGGPGQAVNEIGCPHRAQPYDIPFSAMIPVNMENLIVAGRCISGTHEAMASYRVMNIVMAMGQAAGAAAHLISKEHSAVRQLDPELIRKHLIDKGVEL